MGGHGGLNILPQKRWNVYNFDNREKVRRDEEEAAREEAERQERARRAEAEFKLQKLRDAAKLKRRIVEHQLSGVEERERISASNSELEGSRHINLFSEYEDAAKVSGEKVQGVDKDRKAESKDEKDRRRKFQDHRDRQMEKKAGKETGEPADDHYRLGYGVQGKNGKRPWYMTKGFMVERTQDDKDGKQAVDDQKTSKPRKSLEDLRAERLAREGQEKDKVRRLLVTKARSSGGHGFPHRPDTRVSQYHSGYGNARW